MAEEKIYKLTQNGYNELQEELSNRKTVIRSEISERIEAAKAQGDLSENSEYDDAREAQGKNESRINEIEDILKHCVIVEDTGDDNVVAFGSVVKLKDMQTKKEEVYTIVGSKEINFFENKISEESPVGAAVIGKKKGNTVEVVTPQGKLKYKIVSVEKDSKKDDDKDGK
ncbi:transcription elongation factor GreA [Ruminococcaceae bacterium YRB3002]|nr:transcription elongation factor GreA [Ruminococcaceae bacterium YRB3002]